jgi:predicted O-linked N-acetylglucosamine transferase (SPINDLY family)
MREYEEAALSYQKALALRPAQPAVLNNLGNSLTEVNRFAEALAALDKAIAIKPDYADALNNRGKLLFGSLRYEEALTNYDRALFVNPDHVEALNNRGNVLKELKRHNDAVYDFEKALALQPNHRHAFGGLADAALKVCDWTRTGRISNELEQSVVADRSIVPPLTLLGYSDDPKLQLECAKTTIAFLVPPQPQASWTYHKRHERVRIAYLSADFYRHATAFLMAGLIELHDRQEFEIYGLSYGPDDQSDMRKRLVGAFDHFHEVGAMADGEVARLVRSLEIDIAVDLKGLTRNCRPGMLASRPAPVQVSYLGYPGTMGAPFIDYVMADKIVLPLSQQASWMEKIVHLPHCYQVNDARRVIAPETPTRRDAGLPESGFVFCSFNNNWKITAPVFTVWMRLLAAVPDSVLWLLGDNPAAIQNLRKEASARGVDPNRLVFADMIPLEQHLARHKLADLFLDTIPVNAHTTASDSLWAGLPVLTCQGVGFASRVAASLLNACDLGELATETLEDYEQMAVRLATDNSMLHQLRHKLEANKRHCRLFDTDAFRRNIEAAYRQMWDRFRQGQAPAHFSVQP